MRFTAAKRKSLAARVGCGKYTIAKKKPSDSQVASASRSPGRMWSSLVSRCGQSGRWSSLL